MATTTASSVEQILGDEAEDLLSHRCQTIPVERLTLPGPAWVDDVMTALGPPDARAALAADACSTTAAWPAPATCRSSRSTRASSTRPARRSRPTPTTSTRRTSSSSRSRAAATPWPSTFGVLGIAARKYAHRIPFMSRSTTTSSSRTRTPTTRSCSATVEQALRHGRGRRRRDDLLRLAPSRGARSRRSRPPSPPPTSSAWSRCCGATCATRAFKRKDGGPTTTWPPTSPARPTTSA